MNTRLINSILSAFVIVVCLLWTYFLLFSEFFLMQLSLFQRRLFVVLLLLYAAYRAYRLYTFLRK